MTVAIDPTLEDDMVQLKDEVLAQSDVQDYLEHLRSRSIGLVLAGGGGKGAYEGGVLLALFDCNLHRYVAFAGTSVGALNAGLAHQLFHAKDRNLVARLWGNLTPQMVLRLGLLRTPLGLLIRVGIFLSASIPLVFAHVMTALETRKSASSNTWRGTFYQVKQLPVLIMYLTVLGASVLLLTAIYGWPPDFDFVSITAFGTFVAMAGFLKARNAVGRYLSLASNAPLRQTITENIAVAQIRAGNPPVYCTMTKESTWWQPFEVSEWSNVSDGAEIHSKTPAYVSLADAHSDAEAMDWLLQTAALPEIFPRKPIRGHYVVDGGLSDNVPIYPVAIHKPDKIIVVYLDHNAPRNDYFYTDEAARTWWMAELTAQSNVVTRQQANVIRQRHIAKYGTITQDNAKLFPLEPRLFTAEQFILIAPEQSLGNLLTGTLNFNTAKARRLLRLGYHDALVWIAAYAKHWKIELDAQAGTPNSRVGNIKGES